MRKLLLLLLFAAPSCFAQAGSCATTTCTAAGLTSAQIVAAMPSSGNTNPTVVVNLPSGTGTLTAAITVTIPAAVTNLTVQGATTVSCTGTAGTSGYSCSATDNTILADGISANTFFFQFNTNGASTLVRFTGITLEGSATGTSKFDGEVDFYGNSEGVRVDHNHFTNTGYTGAPSSAIQNGIIRTFGQGTLSGVADHNVVDQNPNGTSNNNWNFIQVGNAYNDTIGNADGTFQSVTPWGTNKGFYGEANQINGSYGNDCFNGGFSVLRYNTFNGANLPMQNHATKTDAGSPRGCRAMEFYHNYASNTLQTNSMVGGKGTTYLIWGNTQPTNTSKYLLDVSTDRNTTAQVETNTPNGWGYCGTAVASNGVGSGWDGASPSGFPPASSSGYPCLDGMGRGQTQQALNGANLPSRLNNVTHSISWPLQYLEPLYSFDNSVTGATAQLLISDGSTTQNTDIFMENLGCAPNGCSSLTTGTGTGTIAQRPTTCSAGPGGTYYPSPTGSYGVAYWETDAHGGNGALDVCTSANTWTEIYTPYTYPHPLTGGGTVSLSPSPENFGTISTGSSSSPVTFTVSNTNTTTATSVTPSVSGGNSADFAITNTGAGSCSAASGSLANGASCTFTIVFTPGAATLRSTTLSVSYSAGDGASPQTSALSGTGHASNPITGTQINGGVKINSGVTIR